MAARVAQPNKPVQMLMSIKSLFLLLDFYTNGNLEISSDIARTHLSRGKTSFSWQREIFHRKGSSLICLAM